ncbi:calponin homology domain-containing protein DDB_G0272472-like [Sebastes umbrosus]|uniref:calponin homology domain-containing protein DDB_G0272472-like n=1 Tax=Sebastes umbrosus TaxID=72105 RepID=UPI0018A05375|nr:calponin homology domain-containing protein DDB_G0272472-like [Sebastes umbrosus]
MEKIVRSRNEDGTVFSVVFPSLDQELVEAATQQAPSKEMQYLRKQNFEQASVIAALREQMAAKDSSWEEEKMRILKALKSERLIRKEAQKGFKGQDNPDLQVQLLQTPSNQLKDSHQHNTELATEITALKQQMAAKESRWELEKNKILMAQRAIKIQAQKQEVTVSLSQSLLEKQNEIVMVKQTPSNELKDSQQVTELAAENAALREQIAGWDLEKNKILNALRSERTIRKEAQRDLKDQDKQNPDLQVQLLQTTSNQLKDSQQHNTELAAENAALREQMAAKESRWELEKNSSDQSLIQVQMDLQTKEQEKQDVTDSLSQSLLEKQNEIVMVKQTTSNQLKDSHQHNTELAAENAALREQMAAKESGWELEKNSSAQSLIQAQMDLQTKEQEKQEVTDSLSRSLLEKQNEIVMVKQTTSNQLKDSHQHNTELAAVNAALREQMAAKESRWELEKNKILIQVQNDLQTKEQEKQEVTDSLSQSLLEKQNEILMVNQRWTEKCEKACEAWKEENREIRETCERELQSALDQKNLMVKSLQDESDRKVSQVVLEKDDLITGLTTAKMALEAEWTTKLAPLEDQIRLKTDTTTDLQAQLLRLQELHQKLDLGALKMTAEEMNAKKKELKKLIVEKEKEEKRQKKEREEREKREKKEREEREKREKKERDEREKEELKSVKKEKEALEKKEKEDLKREKKERKEKERREK